MESSHSSSERESEQEEIPMESDIDDAQSRYTIKNKSVAPNRGQVN